MSNHRYKILSICVPFYFFPIPRDFITLFYNENCELCPNDHILLYLLLDTKEIEGTEIFISLTNAKNKFLEKNNVELKKNKIPRLKLELPKNWLQYEVDQDKPTIDLPLEITEFEVDFSTTEDHLAQVLFDYRNKTLKGIYECMKEDYKKKKQLAETVKIPDKQHEVFEKKSKAKF
ncbi:hypothetical protein ITX54_08410 [Rouxiella silvae]|uniref:Uncharacterized protein n=1 Tax=Rouxiella silvae TaxID=1646373 RepID=A0AA41BW48_9GAMM|nr:hypothetical protein [Rouxiella silvae]MBF6636676.1 hypothetical protein [Rouxiella silvae]